MEEGGEPQDQFGSRLVDHRQGVREDVLVLMDRVLLHRQGRKLGKEVVRQARLARLPRGRAPGQGATTSLEISSRIRSAEMIEIRSAIRPTADSVLGSIRKPRLA